MNNRIKITDSKFKCNIFLFLSVTVFMARLSIYCNFEVIEKFDAQRRHGNETVNTVLQLR
jgi:hypothetical protein